MFSEFTAENQARVSNALKAQSAQWGVSTSKLGNAVRWQLRQEKNKFTPEGILDALNNVPWIVRRHDLFLNERRVRKSLRVRAIVEEQVPLDAPNRDAFIREVVMRAMPNPSLQNILQILQRKSKRVANQEEIAEAETA